MMVLIPGFIQKWNLKLKLQPRKQAMRKTRQTDLPFGLVGVFFCSFRSLPFIKCDAPDCTLHRLYEFILEIVPYSVPYGLIYLGRPLILSRWEGGASRPVPTPLWPGKLF